MWLFTNILVFINKYNSVCSCDSFILSFQSRLIEYSIGVLILLATQEATIKSGLDKLNVSEQTMLKSVIKASKKTLSNFKWCNNAYVNAKVQWQIVFQSSYHGVLIMIAIVFNVINPMCKY